MNRSHTHLSAEQFGELVESGYPDSEAEAHLACCAQCREELSGMREALSLFRASTAAFAERELARGPRTQPRFESVHRVFSPALLWAAAALLVAGVSLPVQLQRHTRAAAPAAARTAAPAPSSGQSDEALLEDINREVSASVPAPMQALEDPTGSASGTSSDAQTSPSRKN